MAQRLPRWYTAYKVHSWPCRLRAALKTFRRTPRGSEPRAVRLATKSRAYF